MKKLRSNIRLKKCHNIIALIQTFVVIRYCVERRGAEKHSFHRLLIFADRSNLLTSVIENTEVKVTYAGDACEILEKNLNVNIVQFFVRQILHRVCISH